jgi:hypothetical protein
MTDTRFWTWQNKQLTEAGVAREVLTLAGEDVQQLQSRVDDPPDCEAVIGGVRCGIEVTELLDQQTLESTKKGAGQHLVWQPNTFRDALQQRIDRKDQPAKVKGCPYARYILVVHANELFLGRGNVEKWLEGAAFQANFITNVYLGLSYDSLGSCAVFKLTLTGRHAQRQCGQTA